MRSVLGIDAAWTYTNPSGVALAKETEEGWELVTVSTSYEEFNSLSGEGCYEKVSNPFIPSATELLNTCNRWLGRSVDLVAIDMPLSHAPITGRRAADNAVSKEYGGRNCSTHSPSSERPGSISSDLNRGFTLAGYPLQTKEIRPPGLIEVYPHPSLVELADAPERLKYKLAKTRKYWPTLERKERLEKVRAQWCLIASLLESHVRGVAGKLPTLDQHATGTQMKGVEDALDAIVCVWIAICALDGHIKPFGDEMSAIWIPVVDRVRLLDRVSTR